jgi:hypothetical protein
MGIAVAAPVVVVIEAVTKARRETPAAEMPFVAEVAAGLGEVVTRGTATGVHGRTWPAGMNRGWVATAKRCLVPWARTGMAPDPTATRNDNRGQRRRP